MTYEIEMVGPHNAGNGRRAYGMFILDNQNKGERVERIVFKDGIIVSDPKYTDGEAMFMLQELATKKLRELADFIEKQNENTVN